ncbi:MAG: hypothetical protein HUU26_06110 [Gemmatimonadaceae bacterium]|nr:hypothetical protein [Gemmatimonadaceae bacterium]
MCSQDVDGAIGSRAQIGSTLNVSRRESMNATISFRVVVELRFGENAAASGDPGSIQAARTRRVAWPRAE